MQRKQQRTTPSGRNARVRNKEMVSEVLRQVKKLDQHSAIKIALAKAGKKKAALRGALHRAAKKEKMNLVMASDERNLYVFRR
jgi:hypothetical protein